MKKIVCGLFLTAIFILGCSSSNNVSNNQDKIRVGVYQSELMPYPSLEIYESGIAGYKVAVAINIPHPFNYSVNNEQVILENRISKEVIMTFTIMDDGNLIVGDEVFYYIGNNGLEGGEDEYASTMPTSE